MQFMRIKIIVKISNFVMNSHKKNGIKNIFLKDEACDIILHSKFPVLILNP